MTDYADVVSHVMDLPIEQRADLAHRLLLSLDEKTPVRESLEGTLVARQQRVASGDYKAADASEMMSRMKRALDQRSQS